MLSIGDLVKVKDCGYSYHNGEGGIVSRVIRIDKKSNFPVKLEGGNCYKEDCLEKVSEEK